MKGASGTSMQSIERRKKVFYGKGEIVECKYCHYLTENLGLVKNAKGKNLSTKEFPFVCNHKKTGRHYTSKVKCKSFKNKVQSNSSCVTEEEEKKMEAIIKIITTYSSSIKEYKKDILVESDNKLYLGWTFKPKSYWGDIEISSSKGPIMQVEGTKEEVADAIYDMMAKNELDMSKITKETLLRWGSRNGLFCE